MAQIPPTKEKLLILGGTGNVGKYLVEAALTESLSVRVATRHPDKTPSSHQNLEKVLFDITAPETFPAAITGIEKVFLISRPGDEQADVFAAPFIESLLTAGVKHIVDLSALHADKRPDFSTRKVEILIEKSGIAWTHLRPNFFMQMFSSFPFKEMILGKNELRVPAGEGRISFIHAKDIAECALKAFLDPSHEKQAYSLTGGIALSHLDIANKLSTILNKKVIYTPLTPSLAEQEMRAAGMAQPQILRVLNFYNFVRQGVCAEVTNAVQHILGRAPLSFEL